MTHKYGSINIENQFLPPLCLRTFELRFKVRSVKLIICCMSLNCVVKGVTPDEYDSIHNT